MSALSRWFRIADYSVAGKIAMIIAIMCVPFGMMVYLYLAQVQKDVDFARSEADGLAAIEKVWGGTLSLGGGQSRTNPADLATVLKDRIALWDTQFKAGAAVAAMADVLRSPKVPADALDTAKTAIQKLADGSNLTLDPDVRRHGPHAGTGRRHRRSARRRSGLFRSQGQAERQRLCCLCARPCAVRSGG